MNLRSQNIANHFRHAQQSAVFESFGTADEKCFWAESRRHPVKQSSTMLRRHHADDDLRCMQRGIEIVGRFD